MSNRILTPEKYLNFKEIEAFRRCLDHASRDAEARSLIAPVRDAAMLHTILGAGLRVSEACSLTIGDLFLSYGESEISILDSKGGKSRQVKIGRELKQRLKTFLKWKRANGEPMLKESVLFLSERKGKMGTRAAQKRFKIYLTKAGIDKDCGIHALRHTFAVLLYRASQNNLRMVQKQLGHSSISTTQIYADVVAEDTEKAVDRMFGQISQVKPKKAWLPDDVEAIS